MKDNVQFLEESIPAVSFYLSSSSRRLFGKVCPGLRDQGREAVWTSSHTFPQRSWRKSQMMKIKKAHRENLARSVNPVLYELKEEASGLFFLHFWQYSPRRRVGCRSSGGPRKVICILKV